jgi:hypothetical protein
MIYSYESGTLKSRYPDFDSEEAGIKTEGNDQEEWFGIRSQIIALIYGWA